MSPPTALEISELLQIEGVVCSVKQPIQRDKNNIFISSKLGVMEQVFICRTVIDRLLGEASCKTDTQAETDELLLWIHGVGIGAIDRAIEVVHNLSTKFFPEQLKVFLFTENLELSEELIRVNKEGEVVERENRITKPVIHIRILVLSPSPPACRGSELTVPLNNCTVFHFA
uniref:Uncharacterized protein n=1 Tax=Schistocephalus solidus TaxID=70667 RepID=A0A0X3NID6_SCHSO